MACSSGANHSTFAERIVSADMGVDPDSDVLYIFLKNLVDNADKRIKLGTGGPLLAAIPGGCQRRSKTRPLNDPI